MTFIGLAGGRLPVHSPTPLSENLARGRWYERGGGQKLRRAFRWLPPVAG
jgi:hypothetical protein